MNTPTEDTQLITTNRLRVLVVDDHDLVRQGLRLIVEGQPGWIICGEATTGQDAVRLAQELHPDIVVIDPPRAGLDQRVIGALAAAKPQKIIYVSCDPATFARDVKRFAQQGYSLKSVTPFDQFPQTHHIENISLLEPAQI